MSVDLITTSLLPSLVSLLERRISTVTALSARRGGDDTPAVARSIASKVSSKVVDPPQSRVENELPDVVLRSVSTDEVTSNLQYILQCWIPKISCLLENTCKFRLIFAFSIQLKLGKPSYPYASCPCPRKVNAKEKQRWKSFLEDNSSFEEMFMECHVEWKRNAVQKSKRKQNLYLNSEQKCTVDQNYSLFKFPTLKTKNGDALPH